jgi:hypothetical protein
MSFRVRHCVECPRCHIRYLLAKNRYANGSYVVVHRLEESEEFTLYCSCGRPPAISRWRWHELARYTVSSDACARGYGSEAEIAVLSATAIHNETDER